MAPVSHPVILVTGLSAVGKTHLCNGLEDVSAELVRFGSLMDDAVKHLGESKDTPLSMLDLTVRREIQRRVFTAIHQRNLNKAVIIDGHVLVEQGESDLLAPGIPHDDTSTLRLDGIVIVVDSPESILARRKKRPEKYSKLAESIERIGTHQDLHRNVAAFYAATNGCFLSVLDLEQSVREDDPSWHGPRKILRQTVEDMFRFLNYRP